MSRISQSTVNHVVLRGRVSLDPEHRRLPSGDEIVTFRLIVTREGAVRQRSRQSVDVFECVAWTARLRGRVARLRADDVVSVSGALRRRFARTGAGPTSFVSVELSTCEKAESSRR